MNIYDVLLDRVVINSCDLSVCLNYAMTLSYMAKDSECMEVLSSIESSVKVGDNLDISMSEFMILYRSSSSSRILRHYTGGEYISVDIYDVYRSYYSYRRKILYYSFKTVFNGRAVTQLDISGLVFSNLSNSIEDYNFMLAFDYVYVMAMLYNDDKVLKRLDYINTGIEVRDGIKIPLHELWLFYNTLNVTDARTVPYCRDSVGFYDILRAVNYVNRILLMSFSEIITKNEIDVENFIEDNGKDI